MDRFPVEDRNVQHAHWEAGEIVEADHVAALGEGHGDGLGQAALNVVDEDLALKVALGIEQHGQAVAGGIGQAKDSLPGRRRVARRLSAAALPAAQVVDADFEARAAHAASLRCQEIGFQD